MNIYFNPLDTACKSITGGIYREEELQLNLFFFERRIRGKGGFEKHFFEPFTDAMPTSLKGGLSGFGQRRGSAATLSDAKNGIRVDYLL